MPELSPLGFSVENGQLTDWSGVPTGCGIYQLLGAEKRILYIGKAVSLKKRLQQHFRTTNQTLKHQRMIAQVFQVQVITTSTESEALLLENQLIKRHRPFFNVLLKDDKTYPELFVSTTHQHPGFYMHRGAHKRTGRYFGPFPNAWAVRSNIQLLSKVFQVRTCEDSVYANRSRPCLQYQTGFCSAPCVGRIDDKSYARDVKGLLDFLSGRVDQVTTRLAKAMQRCAQALDFEQAGRIRDQISSIRVVQARQFVSGFEGSVDWINMWASSGFVLVRVVFIRSGKVLGQQDFNFSDQEDVLGFLGEFLSRFYWRRELPKKIAVSDSAFLCHQAVIDELAVCRNLEVPSVVVAPALFDDVMIKQTVLDVKMAFKRFFSRQVRFHKALLDLGHFLGLDYVLNRIECFDVSHFQGEHTVASRVVFENCEMKRSDYRLYKIKQASRNDDYGAMKEVVGRCFKNRLPIDFPDLLLIDGGVGQVRGVQSVLENLGIQLPVLGISKGAARKRDEELLVMPNFEVVVGRLQPSILPLLQYVRDEAHRFAITNNRKGVAGRRLESSILKIPRVGQKRSQALITHFGGLNRLKNASIYEIGQVRGISLKVAQVIYAYLKESDEDFNRS